MGVPAGGGRCWCRSLLVEVPAVGVPAGDPLDPPPPPASIYGMEGGAGQPPAAAGGQLERVYAVRIRKNNYNI